MWCCSSPGIGLRRHLYWCLHFAGPFLGYQEYEGELLARQIGGQVVTVRFEGRSDGGWWGEVLPTLLGEGGETPSAWRVEGVR